MQWFQDEKIKHRVIGLAVLMSIALIFVPAMVKKSNQRLDRNMNLTLNLPPKPKYPTVEAVKPQVLFQAVKVAQLKLPEVTDNPKPLTVSRAESLSGQTMATRSMIQKTPVMPSTVMVAKADKPVQRPSVSTTTIKPENRPKTVQRVVAKVAMTRYAKPRVFASVHRPMMVKSAPNSEAFSVQVASFARQDNAVYLVRTLQQKGFRASYDQQGTQYRVLVGSLGQRQQAQSLKQQLASAAQLSGFIVQPRKVG